MSDATLEDQFAGRNWRFWTPPTVVAIDDTPTAYRREGSGEPVLYLHGTEVTRAWMPFHQELAKHVDLIAPEHPGYGDTPRDPRWDQWEDWILHYDALIRTLDLGRVHLVGNSLGAWLAANLALFYPERFASVTLISPIGVRMEPATTFVDPFRPLDGTGFADLFNDRGDAFAADLEQMGEFEDGLQKFSEGTTTALLMWNPRYDLKLDHRLARICAPTLIVTAEEDRVANGAASRFAELIPFARLKTLPGPQGKPSSHGMVIEQPGDLVAEIISNVNGAS